MYSPMAVTNSGTLVNTPRRSRLVVIVRHGGRTALLHWQPRLRSVQRLHLALLVAAQHQRVFGRRHVQAHDVFELLDELGIARDFEAAHQVRLQAVGTLSIPAQRDR